MFFAYIYDLQQSDQTRFLVLELVEGETLDAVIKKRGALPLDEALRIARQISDALETAHEKGIIHRDLKPANIKMTPDGKVKLLDFGLARLFEAEPEDANPMNSPTVVTRTGGGVILGTASYMSPEQARGRLTGKQSDVWAFGVILYEMLTGEHDVVELASLAEKIALTSREIVPAPIFRFTMPAFPKEDSHTAL